jgi:MFS family permease
VESRSEYPFSHPARSRLPPWLRATRNPQFRKVWAVATLPHFGYWFCSIAFQWLIAQETGNDPIALGVLYFFMLVPILLLSIPAGVLADRIDRRSILAFCQLATVTIGLTMAILLWRGEPEVWVVMTCAFAVGSVHSIAIPSSAALVANSVPAKDLSSAVPLQVIGMNVARMLGPAFAGAIIFFGGTAGSLLSYAAMGVIGLLVLATVPRLHTPHLAAHASSFLIQVREGMRHTRESPPSALALLIVGVSSLFGASYLAQLPVLAANSSDSTAAFMFLTSAGGFGALISVILVATRSLGRPSTTSAAVMLLVMGAVVTMLGHGPSLAIEMVLVAIAGGLQFGIMTTCNRVIQQVVSDTHRGRVMSLFTMTWGGFVPLGGLWLGILISTAGLPIAFVINGVIAMSFAALILRPGVQRSGEAALQL